MNVSEEPALKAIAVIPAFNEEKTIEHVVRGTLKHAHSVIVVDDGSTDTTSERALAAGATVIRIPRNSGKGYALSIGLATAAANGGEIVICLDGDGQHDAEDIPRIMGPILDGQADMVIGSRFLQADGKDGIPRYRRVGQGALTFATNIGNAYRTTDSQSGFRAFKRDILDVFRFSENGMGIESEMVREAARRGVRIAEVPIEARYQGLDTSTYSPGGHGISVLSSILRELRSEHPLLYFGVSGLSMIIIGGVFGVYSIDEYLSSDELEFPAAITATVLTVVGVLFMLVGLILNAISGVTQKNGNTR